MIFAGLTFHACHPDGPLVNSGIWIIPERSPTGGVNFRMYEQGKQQLAPIEEREIGGRVRGHRSGRRHRRDGIGNRFSKCFRWR